MYYCPCIAFILNIHVTTEEYIQNHILGSYSSINKWKAFIIMNMSIKYDF